MKTKFSGILTLFLAFVVQISFAQDKTVSGVVSDDNGIPLTSATVLVVGTSNGTSTDFDGNYSIKTKVGDKLQFSYVGYSNKVVTVGSTSTINMTLAPDNQLEEVVVVGYGTTTKQSFTGTAKVVTAENLEAKSYSNVSQALAGEAAGVTVINTSGQPGTTSTIRIRGFGSVNGNRDPLYVVDGVPVSGSLNSISPADIKSTTILKDATATAVYGSRGANGVILITTKRGSANNAYVEVDVKSGVNASFLPRNQVIKSPETYIELNWEGLKNKGIATGNPDPVGFANSSLFGAAGIDQSYNMWNVANGAELIDPATGKVRAGVTRRYNPENWEDYGFQTSYSQEASLRMSGGSDKTSYFSSFGYLDNTGNIINSDYRRYNTRLSLTHQAKDWLKATANIGYTNSKTNNNGQSSDSGSIFWFVDNIPAIYPLFLRDADGNTIADPIFGGNEYDYGQSGRGFGALTNSISDAYYNKSQADRHELNGNFSFDITLSDSFSFTTRYGIQYSNDKYTSQNNPFFGSAASQVPPGSLYKGDIENFTQNFLQQLNYKKQFGRHGITAFIAHESNDFESQVFEAAKSGVVAPQIDELANYIIVSSPPNSYTEGSSLESYFGQLNYNLDDKYYLTGTVRRDGSSRFVNEKWGTFGSAGLSWIASKEAFLENADFLDFLKVKTSYGVLGDQGNSLYPGFTTFNTSNLNDEISISQRANGNPDLTWETSKMFQVGLETNLFGFLEANFDYYVKKTDNLLFNRRVGPSEGISSIQVNDGQLTNTGFEFDLSANIVDTKDYKFNVTINGELGNNEITEMPIDPATGLPKILDTSTGYGFTEGRSIFDFYMREYAGVDSADGTAMWFRYYDDINNNNILDAGDVTNWVPANGANNTSASLYEYQKLVPGSNIKKTTTKSYAEATEVYVNKSAIPKVRGAIRLSGKIKNFDISTQLIYSLGGYAYDQSYASLMHNSTAGSNNWSTDILDRWQNPGDVTDVPRISDNQDTNGNSFSTRFLTKSDYLSLNNVRVGYTIPKTFLKASGVETVNISLSADNLFTLSNRKGFNPTTSEDGSTDRYTYAPLSNITLGLRVKF